MTHLHGQRLSGDCWLTPCVRVLPMGWSWAPWCCQQYLEDALRRTALPRSQIMHDGEVPVVLRSDKDLALGAYLDNYLVVGYNAEAVASASDAIAAVLRQQGMVVHEVTAASTDTTFAGVQFGDGGRRLAVKPERVWRLRAAIDEVLRRGRLSPRGLEVLLGHITWAMLLRREALALLGSVYAFARQVSALPLRLWASVRKELRWVASLLPLFATDTSIGWCQKITASDASLFGAGVCSARFPAHSVSSMGRTAENGDTKSPPPLPPAATL